MQYEGTMQQNQVVTLQYDTLTVRYTTIWSDTVLITCNVTLQYDVVKKV